MKRPNQIAFSANRDESVLAAVDRGPMWLRSSDILQILNEVDGEEALSDSAFAVNHEVDLFVHVKVR